MIESHNIAQLGRAEFEVNWDKKIKNRIKIRLGKESGVIKMIDLYKFLLIVGNKEVQEALIPKREETMHRFVRQYSLVLKNDMKAGETVSFNANIDIPQLVFDEIKDNKKGRTKKSNSSSHR